MKFNEHIESSGLNSEHDKFTVHYSYKCVVLKKNLFKLVLLHHTETFIVFHVLRPSTIEKYREGIIIGSGCVRVK